MEYNLDKLAETMDNAIKMLKDAQYKYSVERIVDEIEVVCPSRNISSLSNALSKLMDSLMDCGFTDEQIQSYLLYKAKQTR